MSTDVQNDVREALAFAAAECKSRPELFQTVTLAYILAKGLRRIENADDD